jgi:hypothetical protein
MNAEQELSLCQGIETELRMEYDKTAELTDALCAIGLDNTIIALKHHFGFARNETVLIHPAFAGIIDGISEMGITIIGNTEGITLKDFIAVINKIKKSVIRHSADGPSAYYAFIKQYV